LQSAQFPNAVIVRNGSFQFLSLSKDGWRKLRLALRFACVMVEMHRIRARAEVGNRAGSVQVAINVGSRYAFQPERINYDRVLTVKE
jgi:hypothetical protein